jgi:hypothetical protein
LGSDRNNRQIRKFELNQEETQNSGAELLRRKVPFKRPEPSLQSLCSAQPLKTSTAAVSHVGKI